MIKAGVALVAAKKEEAKVLLISKAAKIARIEHAMVGIAAFGLVTGLHFLEVVACAILVAAEAAILLAPAETT